MQLFFLIIFVLLYDLQKVELACIDSYHKCSGDTFFKCIPQEWVCDHNEDCKDGSDEAGCPIVSCSSDEFRCRNSDLCIKKSQICDGFKDCADNSDERNCKSKECEQITEYDCQNKNKKECISLPDVCSMKMNCSNQRNLHENCTHNMCNQLDSKQRCSHTCINKYSSFVCDCPPGMKLNSDNVTCKKIDICLENPDICDQECTVTTEGHLCSCYEGYTNNSNRCILNNSDVAAYILYLSFNAINVVTLFNENKEKERKVIPVVDKLVTFDTKINGRNMEVYSSHVGNEDILSLKLLPDWQTAIKAAPAHDFKKIESKDLKWNTSFYSIAADSIRDLVFWTDTRYSTISVFNSSSLDKVDINITNCYYPISLVVDPISTKIYWIDLGKKDVIGPRIMMSNMDGSEMIELIKLSLVKPVSLALDVENQHLYWTEVYPGSIKFLDLKITINREKKIKTLFETFDFMPYSLALYKNRIYWSDMHQNRIYSVHKLSGKGLQTVVEQVQSKTIRIISSKDDSEFKKRVNGLPLTSTCSGVHNPCQHSCLPSSSKKLPFCFQSPCEKKTNSSSWWFLVIPLALLSFIVVAFVKYRNFKSRHQRHLPDSSQTVLVYDHVKFWDDGRDESLNDSNIVNVPDSVPILQTV